MRGSGQLPLLTLTCLLEGGPNPEIRDCWGFDAFACARSGEKSVLEVLTRWKEKSDRGEA